jgi:galactosylgalactosylxylosylprotein 3-beta-glucuronosyltransferase 3
VEARLKNFIRYLILLISYKSTIILTERPFPLDMAGFAISFDLLENNEVAFKYEVQRGYQESEILRQITTRDELQPLAMNKILVWHTRTEKSKNDNELK